MKGIILHEGRGSRLDNLYRFGPKKLIPVANKPISEYVLDRIVECGIKDVAIALGDSHPWKVREHFGDGSRFGVRVSYFYQGEPKGIAHAVGLCQEFVGDSSFVTCLGDNLFQHGFGGFVREFEEANADAMLVLSHNDDPTRFGVAKLDADGRLVEVVEKPRHPSSSYVVTGVYKFKPVVFDVIRRLKPSNRNELEITDTIQRLMDGGCRVEYRVAEGWWRDTGTYEDVLESNRLILDGLKDEQHRATRSGIPDDVIVGSRLLLGDGAVIKGPAVLGDDVEIADGVKVGPYVSIGNRVSIRSGEVEDSIVMDGAYLDVSGRISSSVIGPGRRISSSSLESGGSERLGAKGSTIIAL